MTEFLIYLFQTSISILAFFAVYALFLKNLTFYKGNRAYLLTALIFSFSIPLLKIELPAEAAVFHQDNMMSAKFEELTTKSLQPIADSPQPSLTLSTILFYVYAFIAILSLLKGIKALHVLFGYTRNASIPMNGLKVIYKMSGFANCSFFNYVFINPSQLTVEETEMLLKHEQVHATQRHSADKIFLMFCKSVLWFNPLIYLYDEELEKVHEFEADAIVSNPEDRKNYARMLMKMANRTQMHPLTHSFGKHPVKERIYMLFTNQSKKWSVYTYALMIPVCIGLTSIFSVKSVSASPIFSSPFTLIIDPGHGGSDHGAILGQLNEKQLTLELASKVRSVAESKGIKVVSSRIMDKHVSLKDRAGIKGDFLLSLHFNTSANRSQNGIEIISSQSPGKVRASQTEQLSYRLYQNFKSLDGIATSQFAKNVTGSYILKNSTAPSIMLELGYLSNSGDIKFLTNPSHQDELARAIVESVVEYRVTFKNNKLN